MLASIKELIKIQLIHLRTDMQKSPNGGEFMLDNRQVFMDPCEIPSAIIETQLARHKNLDNSKTSDAPPKSTV